MNLTTKLDLLAVAVRRAEIAERAAQAKDQLIREQTELINELYEQAEVLCEQAEQERVQREAHQAPPPCNCGHLTYEVWCPKCGKRLDQRI